MKSKTSLATVTKEITWDMAHRLSKHKGQCANLHGHTYKLQVTLCSTSDKLAQGMVIDFADIKHMLDDVKQMYDHRTILDGNSNSDASIAEALSVAGCSYRMMTCEPTAENMAAEIMNYLIDELKRYPGVFVFCVRLYETPTSFAEVSAV